MLKSKHRSITKCENCSICDSISEMHEHNDISELLVNVKQWDITVKNQYKSISNFECLVCFFQTSVFKDWKCHIMSLSHLTNCHKIEDLYSYVCFNKKCKILLYGSEKSLNKHRINKHYEMNIKVSGVSILMVEVMKRYFKKLNPLYFCSHCKKFDEKPIHSDKFNATQNNIRQLIVYYCKFCRVTFFSSAELIDYHSLSVEHMTLKCLEELYSKAKINSKKLKVSEQLNQSNDNIEVPVIQKLCFTDSVRLPMVMLNRFQDISQVNGKCKLCNTLIRWNSEQILSHLINCTHKYDLPCSNNTTVNIFNCNVCGYSTNNINKHKVHVTSLSHLTSCYNIECYSYICSLCNVYMYSSIKGIKKHKKMHKVDNTVGPPMLFTFMANVLKYFNENPNSVESIHYYGENKLNEFSKQVSIPCYACKIEIHTSIDDFSIHEITNEHILLTFLTTKFNDKVLEMASDLQTLKPLLNQNILTSQRLDNLEVTDIKHVQSVKKNKNQTNVDVNLSELFDNGKISQSSSIDSSLLKQDIEPLKNLLKQLEVRVTALETKKTTLSSFVKPKLKEVIIEENDKEDDVDLFGSESEKPQMNNNAEELSNILLTQKDKCKINNNYSNKHYVQYFKHKMKLLNLLQQYKDRIIKTLSYYCNTCDFMTEEKYVWDKHNQTHHLDDKCRLTIFCSTCSMLMVGVNCEEHNNSKEHCTLLKLLHLLKHANEDIMEKTVLYKPVKKCISNERFIESNTNKLSELNNINNTEEKQNKNNDDLIKANTFLSSYKNDCQYECENNKETTKTTKHIYYASTSTSNNSTNVIQTNVEEQEKVNCGFVSTSTDKINNTNSGCNVEKTISEKIIDKESKLEVPSIYNDTSSPPISIIKLKNENISEELEDKAYGEYVTQRLKNIKNNIVKQDIKLEIDFIFCTKMKINVNENV